MTDESAEVESPQTETAETNVADASTEDIRTALGLPEAQPTEGLNEGVEDAPPDELDADQGLMEGEPVDTGEEILAKRRIRPRTAEDQQVIDLYRSEGFAGSFDDASRIIYGKDDLPPPQQQQQQPAPDPHERERTAANVLQQDIHTLETQVSEAADNLETAEALQLQRDIMRKELQLQSIKDRYERDVERRQTQDFNAHRDKAMESRDAVYATHPELSDQNSVVRKHFDDYVTYAQRDPDYAAVFESPKWPEIMAREFLASAPPEPQQLPVEAPPQQAPVMGNQARVLTSGSAAQPANSQPTAQQVVDNLPNLSREDLYTLLGQPDGQRRLI